MSINPLVFLFPRVRSFSSLFSNTRHPCANSSSPIFAAIRKNRQKQSPRGVPRKRCSENMQQIYRRTPMSKYDFNKVAKQLEIPLRHGCSPVNLLHVFRTTFSRNTSGWLLLSQSKVSKNISLNETARTSVSKGLELNQSFRSSQQKLFWNYLNCIYLENNFQIPNIDMLLFDWQTLVVVHLKFYSDLAANQQILNEF